MDGEERSELGTVGDDILFGPFRLLISARRLERDSKAIPIGSRALDLLVALVERAGEILSKSELIERAWPNLHVDEANLRVHIANLRKFLDDDRDTPRYVANVPSRGYVFVAPVHENAKPIAESSAQRLQVFCLPPMPARIVGREDTIAALIEQLVHARFISLVGPGGLGKTTLALSLAHQLRDAFQDQVVFVDLSVISDPDLATAQVASALGCQAYAEDPSAAVVLFVRQRRLLLVLDNCEHVIDAISNLAEQLFREVPSLSLLTTSREALRVEGETVHFVEPLAMPSMSGNMTLDQAAQSAAVRLFLERGLAGGAGAQFADEDADAIVEICRRLDGIPLAIELAASRVGSYGVQATARLLNERLELLWRGRRSAPSRHQTLGAMLDWSYHLLSENERSILASLSVFMGPFSLTSAQAVCQDERSENEVAEALGGLVDKSLLSVVANGRAPLFRLLDTTRSYARDKLATGARKDSVSRRHAMYVCSVLEGLDTSVTPFANRDILPFLGDVRAALTWVCADFGSFEFGVSLLVGAERFFLRLSLLREARAWCERAMAILPADERGGENELEILIGLAISAMFTAGNSDEVLASIHRGLDIAETLGRRRDQLTLLSGLHLFLTRTGKFLETVSVAERFSTIAREAGNSVQQISADFMLGTSRHLVGPQDLAVEHCEAGLKRSGKSLGQNFDQFGFDQRVRALVAYARSLWLAGRPDQAAAACRQVIAEAEQLGQPTNICIAHIYSATVFVWRGDLDRASECVARLMQEATVHHLVSIGVQTGPLIGAQKGPPVRIAHG